MLSAHLQEADTSLAVGGAFCALGFSLPLAKRAKLLLRQSVASLIYCTGLGALLAGSFCSILRGLPLTPSLALAILMPIASIALLDALSKGLGNESGSTLYEVEAHLPYKGTPALLVALALGSGLAHGIISNNWMPQISYDWMLNLIPLGIALCITALATQMFRLSFVTIYSAYLGIASIVSLLALTPLFQNAISYIFFFIAALGLGSVPIVGVAIRSARAAGGRPRRSNHP